MALFNGKLPNIYRRALLVSLLLLSAIFLNAPPLVARDYPRDMSFVRLLQDKDVTLGEVEALLQDYEGFIWLGGRSALLRFDGYEFKHVEAVLDPAKPNETVPVSLVMDILEDRQQRLWAATKLGLLKFDRKRELFTRLIPPAGSAPTEFNTTVNRLAEAPNGEILLGAYTGLVVLDPETNTVTRYTSETDAPNTIPSNTLHEIFVHDSKVWMGTDFGLSIFDWETKEVVNYGLKPELKSAQRIVKSEFERIKAKQGNLITTDGTFSSGQGDFNFILTAATVSFEGQAVINIDKAADEAWHVQLKHIVPVESGKEYIFCYDAKANINRTIRANIDTGPDEYKALSEQVTHEITTEYKQYSISFQPEITDETARLAISLGLDASTVSIDNVGVYEGKNCGNPSESSTFFEAKSEHKKLSAVRSIHTDIKGLVWLATDDGAYQFNPVNEALKHYVYSPDNPKRQLGKIITDIYLDGEGLLWLGSEDRGLSVYRHESDSFIQYVRDDENNNSLSENSVKEIIEDRNGDLWIATFPSEVNYYDRSNSAVSVYRESSVFDDDTMVHDNVTSIQEAKNGDLWVATEGGIDYFDRHQDKFIHYDKDFVGEYYLSSDSIQVVLLDSKNELWAGSWGNGLIWLNRGTNSFDDLPFSASAPKNYNTTSKTLNSASVWSLLEDSQGNIWIGTHDGGLSVYDKKAKTFSSFVHSGGDPTSLSNNLVWSLLEDSEGYIWAGTAWGLNKMDPKTRKFKRFFSQEGDKSSLSNSSAVALLEDKKKRLWVGTDVGLNLYDKQRETFRVYTTEHGLVDNGIRCLAEDKFGHIWIGTNNGISVLDVENNEFKNYKWHNGEKISGFNNSSALSSKKGEVILGGKKGLRIFNVDKMQGNKVPPPLVYTDLKLFTKSVVIGGEDGILSKPINHSDHLVFNYEQTMFSISFAALNYRSPMLNQYKYKLDGFDEEWREVGAQRTAVYTNLDAGRYTFRVRGSNNDGVWSLADKTIEINQLPPPWFTWWAKLVYASIAVALLLLFIRHQGNKRRAVEKINKVLESRVAERTLELESKNNDIQALLSNMRQGIFTIESTEKIHSEYSSYLETIFETNDIATKNAVKFLFANAKIDADILSQIVQSLHSMLGADQINFEFNAHLLITDYSISINGKVKYLKLEWNPILKGNIIEKVMVSVRDITQLKEMEKDAEAQHIELEMISQLINVSDVGFIDFEKTTTQFIKENRQLIQSFIDKGERYITPDVIPKLFRNMHTLKGNARTYNFIYINGPAHAAEDVYVNLRKNIKAATATEMLDHLACIEKMLLEYVRIYNQVLRCSQEKVSLENNGALMEDTILAKFNVGLKKIVESFPELKNMPEVQTMDSALVELQSVSFEEILRDQLTAVPTTAQLLGKPAPVISIDCNGFRIKPLGRELLSNCFSHLLNNAIDHGIEEPEQRLAKNKNAAGAITVQSKIVEGSYRILIRDDGRGIDLSRLRQKVLRAGLLEPHSNVDEKNLVNLIFESGISTKNDTSTVSGRGVGLDAVKQFLQEQGGAITINLLAGPNEEGCVAFEFELTLPPEIVFTDTKT